MTVRKLPLFVVLVCLAVLGQQQPNPNFTGKVTRLEETPAFSRSRRISDLPPRSLSTSMAITLSMLDFRTNWGNVAGGDCLAGE